MKIRMISAAAATALALTAAPAFAQAQSSTTPATTTTTTTGTTAQEQGSSLGTLLFGAGENEKSTPEKIIVVLGIVTFVLNALTTGAPMIQQLMGQLAPR